MTLAKYNEVMGKYATAFRMLNEALREIAEAYPEGNEEIEVTMAFGNAQLKFREAEHWMRDLRAVFLNKTDESKQAAKDKAEQFKKLVEESMKEKEDNVKAG
jgi:uncharacterized protein YukE